MQLLTLPVGLYALWRHAIAPYFPGNSQGSIGMFLQHRAYSGGASETQRSGCATVNNDPRRPCASLAGRADAQGAFFVGSEDCSEPPDQQSTPSFSGRSLQRLATLRVAIRIVMMHEIA